MDASADDLEEARKETARLVGRVLGPQLDRHPPRTSPIPPTRRGARPATTTSSATSSAATRSANTRRSSTAATSPSTRTWSAARAGPSAPTGATGAAACSPPRTSASSTGRCSRPAMSMPSCRSSNSTARPCPAPGRGSARTSATTAPSTANTSALPGVALGAGYGWESGPRGRGEEIPFGDPARRRHPGLQRPRRKGRDGQRRDRLPLGVPARARLHDPRIPSLHRRRHHEIHSLHRERGGLLRRTLPEAREDALRARARRRRPARDLSLDVLRVLPRRDQPRRCHRGTAGLPGGDSRARRRRPETARQGLLPRLSQIDSRPTPMRRPRATASCSRPPAGSATRTSSARSSTRSFRSTASTCSARPRPPAGLPRHLEARDVPPRTWCRAGTRTASSSPAWA